MVKRQRYEKAVAALALWACAGALMASEPALWRVWFQSKPYSSFTPNDTLYQQTLQRFTPEALRRRTLHGFDPVLTLADAPIPSPWIAGVTAAGSVEVLVESRWWTYVVIETDTPTAQAIGMLPYVRSITPAASAAVPLMASVEDCAPPDAGASALPLDLLHLPIAHAAGAYGQGALIGMLDNGFRWKTHEALQSADVREEYDIIFNDSNTANEPGDHPEQDGHGTFTMSMIAGWRSGVMLGAAPFASLLLAKTEDMRYERRIELDNFVAGVEWLERRGADVLSASVGYYTFDAPDEAVTPDDLNGHSTLPARALNEATARGMLCVTAAGNGGPARQTLITPGDADSAITVGAVQWDGTIAKLSSSGPTADGRLKPDVCAAGVSILGATNASDTSYAVSNGTSLSTPQVAGLAGVLRSICPPTIRTYELRDAIYRSSDTYPTKDSARGFGIPRFDVAAELLSPCITPFTATPGPGSLRVIATVFHTGAATTVLLVREHGSTREPDTIYPDRTFERHVIFELPSPPYSTDTLDLMVLSTTPTRTNTWPQGSMHAVARATGYTPCGASRPVISSVPLANTDRNGVLFPNPARPGDRVTLPETMPLASAVTLVAVTGETVATLDTLPDAHGLAVMLPTCAPGLYILRTSTFSSSLLMVIP